MFKNIRKCLDDLEKTVDKLGKEKLTKEEDAILDYFYLHMAEAMLLECPDVGKIAKTILFEKEIYQR